MIPCNIIILPVNERISYNGGTDVDDSQNDGGHVWVDARAGLFEDRHRVKHNCVDATELEKRDRIFTYFLEKMGFK